MQPNQSQNFMEALRKNWFIIVFIGTIVIGWSNFSNRLEATEKAQVKQESDIAGLTSKTTELQGAIIEIKANYLFIKSALEEIKVKK
jgi:hypothetical protein